MKYRFRCDKLECDEEYIKESSRTFGERLKEHLKASCPIYDCRNTTDNTTTVDTLGRENKNLTGVIKESIYIRFSNPSLSISNWNKHPYTFGHSTCHLWHNISKTYYTTPFNENVAITFSTVAFHLPHLSTHLCGHTICDSSIKSATFGITSAIHIIGLTSANINQWPWHLPFHKRFIIYLIYVCKITGHTNTNTHIILEIVKYNIFPRPKGSILFVWQKLFCS